MSIIKEIRSAIIAQMIKSGHVTPRYGIARILCDSETYMSVKADALFDAYCNPFEVFENVPIITIMGIPLVPTDMTKGFEIMLKDGTTVKPAAKDTAQD